MEGRQMQHGSINPIDWLCAILSFALIVFGFVATFATRGQSKDDGPPDDDGGQPVVPKPSPPPRYVSERNEPNSSVAGHRRNRVWQPARKGAGNGNGVHAEGAD